MVHLLIDNIEPSKFSIYLLSYNLFQELDFTPRQLTVTNPSVYVDSIVDAFSEGFQIDGINTGLKPTSDTVEYIFLVMAFGNSS